MAAAIVVAAATALPLVYLVIRGFEPGVAEALETIREPRTLGLLIRTVLLAVVCAGAATLIGVPLAMLTVRASVPMRRTLTVLLALPLAIPSYVAAYTLVAFAGPHGMLADLLGRQLPAIYGLAGASIAITATTYPLVFLTVRSALLRMDRSSEEASRTLGASTRETFRRVTWPAIRPAAAAGAFLVALYAIHDFGAVALLRYDTFSRSIFVAYQASFDRSRAAILALVLLALALLVSRIELGARGRALVARSHGSAPRLRTPQRLGRGRALLAAAGITIVLGIALVLPIAVLIHWIARSARVASAGSGVAGATAATLLAAAAGAVATVIAAYPIGRLLARRRGPLASGIGMLSTIGYALPGIVVALSLVYLATRTLPAIYQTLPLLVFAYVVIFLPQASGALRASFEHLPVSREEASRVLGVSRSRTTRRVVLPSIRPAIVAATALVFVTAAKELPATMLLSPPGFRSLAMRVYSETAAARLDRAAIPVLLLLVITAIPLGALLARDRIGTETA